MMSNDQKSFLQLLHLPARLNAEEAAWYLGFSQHDIPVLTRAGLLKPLVRAQQATKYFATATLARLREDDKWLERASVAVTKHWQDKNHRVASERNSKSPCPPSTNGSRTRPGTGRFPTTPVEFTDELSVTTV